MRVAEEAAQAAGVPFAYSRQRPAGQPATSSVVHRLLPALLLAAAIALLMLEAIPNLYPRFCQEEPFPTILTVHAYERATGLVGVDPEGSYFPRAVVARPTGSPLEADFAAAIAEQRHQQPAEQPHGQQACHHHTDHQAWRCFPRTLRSGSGGTHCQGEQKEGAQGHGVRAKK